MIAIDFVFGLLIKIVTTLENVEIDYVVIINQKMIVIKMKRTCVILMIKKINVII